MEKENFSWEIEALRGMAALMVIFAHYAPPAGLPVGIWNLTFTGVDLFFVLSGFVFAKYLRHGFTDVSSFLIRRLFRIYPLYFVAFVTYVAIRIRNGSDTPYLMSHLLLIHTWHSYEEAFYYNPAFWSLPPEIEFYLLLPILSKLTRSNCRLWSVVCLAMLLHLFIGYNSPTIPGVINSWVVIGVHLPGLLIEFLIGSIIWLIHNKCQLSFIRRLQLLLSGCLTWIVLGWTWVSIGDSGIAANSFLRGNTGLIAAIAFGLIISSLIGLVRSPTPIVVSLSQWAGNVSYGLYLFHNAIPALLAPYKTALSSGAYFIYCFLITVFVSILFHVLIERPARTFGRKLAYNFKAASH